MPCNLEGSKIGDTLTIRARSSRMHSLDPSHHLLTIVRMTPTMVCCEAGPEFGRREWKFRKADGKEIGQEYSYAELATPELLEAVITQKSLQARDRAAATALADLEGRPLHQLKLPVEQKEALAAAWLKIKAMEPGTPA